MIPEFYKPYVKDFQNEHPKTVLNNETQRALDFYKKISEEKSVFRYEKDKWSIKELLGHICDSEQIFAYRVLSFLRGEEQSLPGFEQDDYVKSANFDAQSWESLISRFQTLREITLMLLNEMSDQDLDKIGTANGSQISIRAILLVIAGHERHHRKIVAERYLS